MLRFRRFLVERVLALAGLLWVVSVLAFGLYALAPGDPARMLIEASGTQPAPEGLDWICVSPKADSEIVLTKGNELKLVYPQPLARPERFAALDFEHFFLQPMDSVLKTQHTKEAVAYCMANPQWRLSVQMHKVIGID